MHRLAFHPGNSFMHRLYPVTKLAWLIIGSILVFLFSQAVWLIALTTIFLVVISLIYPPVWKIKGFRFALLTSFMLLILHLLFIKSGQTVLYSRINTFNITTDGLSMGFLIGGRFLSIILLSYLFILTTEPNQLAYALMKAGLPYRFGFMLVTALRLAPILEEEGKTIYRAQLVRGVRYDQGALKKILPIIKKFFTPLIISALRRVDKLVFSMEGRGFGSTKTRTFRRQSSPTGLDLITSTALLIIYGFLLFLNFRGGQ